ncbi:hypothetical protein [Marinilactibacillus psychrotolerans]|uniref:Uncharacterized protein n=1 Tax=Marinilactibacillus psychrotolerans TaxID=191770 RepID=A0ABW8UH50_9LACT
MVVTLNKEVITKQVSNLNSSPAPTTVLKDYHIKGTVVKEVPFILDNYNKYEPYLLDGNTLERVYNLVNENEMTKNKKEVIYYN